MPRAKVVSESDSEGEKPTRTTRRTRQNRKSSASDGEKATSGSNINDTDTSVAKNKKKAKEKLKQDEPESGKLSSLDNNSTPPKKKKSAKNEQAEDGASTDSENDIVEAKKEKKTAKKKSGKSKIASSESNDSESDVSEVKNKKGKSKKSKKSADDEEASDDNDVKVVENGKKKANKRGKKTSSDDDDVIDLDESGGSESDVAPKKGKKNVKKRPKRKLISDSESEVSEGSASPITISDSESSPEKPKRKRKRVRAVATSDSQSDGSGSDSKSPKKGRKNIKKLKKLSETTKAVNQAEAERIKRISERQKIYNSVFNASCFGEKKTLDSLVLDFDPKSKKALVAVEDALVKKLKPHQGKGIKFMWDSCFESLDVAKKQEGSGCILAHCMGLGKTLQVIALTYTLLTQASEHVKSVLVLCPLSTVLNWYSEFEKWLEGVDQSIEVYHLTDIKTNPLRADICMQWHKNGGVMILSYNNFRILTGSPRGGKKMKEKLLTSILDPGPDLIVCDEGHLLKNEQSAISKAVSKMRTMRRIVLTGTPLQNNLQEYHCMVQFVKPNLLGEKREFLNRFVNPIMNGQYGDSTAHDVKVMKQRSHVLHKKLEGIVQRADYTVLKPYLPEKYEYVISLRLSDLQLKLYQHYLENVSRNMMEDKKMGGSCLFQDFNNLRLVWTHPYLLKLKALEDDKKEEMKEFDESDDSIKDFVTDGSDTASSTSSDEGSGSMSGSDEEYKPSSTRRVTRGLKQSGAVTEEEMKNEESDKKDPLANQWWSELVTPEMFDDITLSAKLMLLFSILRECEEIGDKVLVFSQSIVSLNAIEYFLEKIHEATRRKGDFHGFKGSWMFGLDYFRLDGTCSSQNRSTNCDTFNSPKNLRGRLFLISTRAGGLGINLTGANRAVVFDVSWNPSHDVQSIFRIYRFGQTKPCYIYRFVARGTMEEKVYERQVAKISLAYRVVDEQQVDRHFSSSDLRELYMLPDNKEEALTPIVPKDRLMAELLKEHKNTIFKIHEHDSLLENTEEEDLDEEERKAAWEAYENEKNYNANTARMNLNMGMPGMGMGMPMPGMGMGMPGMPGMQPGMYQQRFPSTEGLPGPRNNYGIHPGMVGLNMAPGSRPANSNAFPKMFTPSLLQQFYMQNPKVISNLYQKLKADNPLKPESQINGMLQQCVMGYLNAAMAQSQHSMNQGMPSAPPTAAPAAAPSGPIPMPPPSGPIPMPPPGGAIPMPAPGGAPSTAK